MGVLDLTTDEICFHDPFPCISSPPRNRKCSSFVQPCLICIFLGGARGPPLDEMPDDESNAPSELGIADEGDVPPGLVGAGCAVPDASTTPLHEFSADTGVE